MRWIGAWLVFLVAGCVVASCGETVPPFDELPLRDALRADPGTVAALSDPARARLAARFEQARAHDGAVDRLPDDSPADPGLVVVALDRIRQGRQAEPLLTGVISQGAAWTIAGNGPGPTPLPSLEGATTGPTAAMEARALAGTAGDELRLLLAATGAHRLARVLAWPVGAVAVDDVIYVNAAWLVALAATERPPADGGVPSEGVGSAASLPAVAGKARQRDGTQAEGPATAVVLDSPPGRVVGDAGVPPASYGPYSPPPASQTVTSDGCNACADSCGSSDSQSCDSSGDGSGDDSGDGCDSGAQDTGGSDSCAGGDQGGDACAGGGGDVQTSGCQIGARPGRRRAPSAWVVLPLAYLLFRRYP